VKKIILSTNISLDGYMGGPNGELDWHFQNWNDEMSKFAFEQLKTMDTILAGRVTYESMATHFSGLTDEFSQMMNAYSKIVFSKTLEKAEWNNSKIIRENIAEEIAKLKQQPGKDMIMWGGVSIVTTFMELNLIDEYRIFIAPIVLGSGINFGKDLKNRLNLKLLKTQTFSNGVVLHYYEPAPPAPDELKKD
jgi:dihydrofolate reductase